MDEVAGIALIVLGAVLAGWGLALQRRGLPRVPEEGVPTMTGEPVGDALAEELYELERRPRLALAVLYLLAAAAIAGGVALLVT